MKKYIIAFDLHGTLLDLNWNISNEHLQEILSLLNDLNSIADFFIITGNDYSFVEKHLPKELIDMMSGFVLETGSYILMPKYKFDKDNTLLSIYLDDMESSNKHCSHDWIKICNELLAYFQEKKYSFIKYFGNRKASISIFTCDENGGEDPLKFYDIIQNDLNQHKFGDLFFLTWSNVALDIIPNDVSKWIALKSIAEYLNNQINFQSPISIISFVDSYNDREIAEYSNYSILPSNCSKSLIEHLRKKNKLVLPLNRFHFIENLVYISENKYTLGVIEGLKFLKNINIALELL
ncbi:MAG: HAD hydrolase family protein [Candidatus Cloacimonetes bacterium]|nr:HAD hydrolase family protein [Candidatus Cloacimonadota bacterium]